MTSIVTTVTMTTASEGTNTLTLQQSGVKKTLTVEEVTMFNPGKNWRNNVFATFLDLRMQFLRSHILDNFQCYLMSALSSARGSLICSWNIIDPTAFNGLG